MSKFGFSIILSLQKNKSDLKNRIVCINEYIVFGYSMTILKSDGKSHQHRHTHWHCEWPGIWWLLQDMQSWYIVIPMMLQGIYPHYTNPNQNKETAWNNTKRVRCCFPAAKKKHSLEHVQRPKNTWGLLEIIQEYMYTFLIIYVIDSIFYESVSLCQLLLASFWSFVSTVTGQVIEDVSTERQDLVSHLGSERANLSAWCFGWTRDA